MVRKKIHTRSHGSLNDVACIDNRRTTRLDRECLPIVCMVRFLQSLLSILWKFDRSDSFETFRTRGRRNYVVA